MNTTAKTLAWLEQVKGTPACNLCYSDWEELHAMLPDLIHIDDVKALRAALRDRDLGEAVEAVEAQECSVDTIERAVRYALEAAVETAYDAMRKYAEDAYASDGGRMQNAAKTYCADEIATNILALAADPEAVAAIARGVVT